MSIKFLGHRIHPMLVGFPLGLLTTAIVFDLLYLTTQSQRWADVAFCLIGAGVLSGLVAAPFGSYDWLGVEKGTRAKRIGLYHGMMAMTSMVLFAVSWWLRYETPTEPSTMAMIFSMVGVIFLGFAGWLGGELVERLGIGVDQGAHPNAPSSLSGLNVLETIQPLTKTPSNRSSKAGHAS